LIFSPIPHVNKVEPHILYIESILSRNCPNYLNLLCMRCILTKFVQDNYVRTLKMILRERFQFLHHIDKIVKPLIVSMQVKKTQDGPMKGIYDPNMVIWSKNHAKSPMAQLVCPNSLLYGRFPTHQNLKEIAGFDSPSSNVQSKNMRFHIFFRILWEFLQKVL